MRLSNIKLKQAAWMLLAAGAVSGCVFKEPAEIAKDVLGRKSATTPEGGSTANTLDQYKREVGQRILQVNSTRVYMSRPQALLRSVVVVRLVVDAQGALVRSEIARSNRDKVTEDIAMAALRGTAPFPKPPPALLAGGRLELSETWLFNTDGKFQIRSVAEPQMDR